MINARNFAYSSALIRILYLIIFLLYGAGIVAILFLRTVWGVIAALFLFSTAAVLWRMVKTYRSESFIEFSQRGLFVNGAYRSTFYPWSFIHKVLVSRSTLTLIYHNGQQKIIYLFFLSPREREDFIQMLSPYFQKSD